MAIAQRVLTTVEFPKVRQKVLAYCASALGREEIEQLVPKTTYEEVVEQLEQTEEAFHLLRLRGAIPLGGIFDIRPAAKRAQLGGVLTAMELMEIASTIRASRKFRQFITDFLEAEEFAIPHFQQFQEDMPIVTAVEKEIQKAIDENGKVLDSASSKLRSVRQTLRAEERRVRERLESYTRGRNAAKMLSDSVVTIRNDRFVIPVKAEYRSHFGGVVHDSSASGQTLFIEPDAVVTLNNAIRNSKMAEKEEVDRILWTLSIAVQEVAHELFILTKEIARVDAVVSKARFGHANHYHRPKVNQEGHIQLLQAKHPLLEASTAVANDIIFGDAITTIVITGPNTGGKTVTLKTVGLCIVMAQAGLPIPVQEGSEIAVFDAVFADIGDEQSIEQSLSTFSSHMVNIVDILAAFTPNSLLLFDELGSGTDPQEGAALAISILDEVHGTGARVMATTHYPELKAYGYNRPGMANASVEFDIDTLSPTYRLLIGVPGRSNAFEISERLGLPLPIIDRARSFTGEDRGEVNHMIASLEASRLQSERDTEQLQETLRQTEQLQEELQSEWNQFEIQKERLKEQAKEQANQVIEEARSEAEAIIADLRAKQKATNQVVKEHELIDAKKRLDDAAPIAKKKKQTVKTNRRPLAVGDEVTVLQYGQQGTLLAKASEKEWTVQIGILKMNIPEAELQYKKPEKLKEPTATTSVRSRDRHTKLELDLRGERYEDALYRTEKYLDDALLANYHQVSIIHGKGTGALRTGVQKYLKRHSRVKSFRFGDAAEGGYGVTVVELK